MGMKVAIIGGVAGGASTAARLRRLDEDAEITLFERGEYISFANCGLPYHVGGEIKRRESLLLFTPEMMKGRFNIDVRINTEITEINRQDKTLTAVGKDGEYTQTYDKLVISTGSSPLRPRIPGIDSKRIMTLWTVPDADAIRQMVDNNDVFNAVVVGGGFIGLEMAENLKKLGLNVTIVEMLDQVMAPIDFEMAQLVHGELKRAGVNLYLGDGVKSFDDRTEWVNVELNSGKVLQTDIVILSIGVRPNSELARAAGLDLNERGGIVVDERMRTSDPDIYAVGDVVETINFPGREKAMVPLAGPANKQGRIAANNLAGIDDVYDGTQGTSIARVFNAVAATTGVNEKTLVRNGMEHGKDYHRIWLMQNSHASYYPGAKEMAIKLLFKPDGQVLGAQVVGEEGVDKRIDILATAMRFKATVQDLTNLELAYAPPYSSAKAPVNMAGFVAENVLGGLTRIASWDAVEKLPESDILLDVREPYEVAKDPLENSVNIPIEQLRGRLGELDKGKGILVICAAGVRAHTAARMLANNGFKDVSIYPGGMQFYLGTHSS